MKKIYSGIKQLFFKQEATETLGFFRIAVSGFALIQLFVLLPDWMSFYGPKGLLPWEISDALSTTQTPSLLFISNLLQPLRITPEATVYIITTAYLISLIGLLIGFKTRLMGALAWLMHIVLNTTGHFTAYGVETFTHIALFYCTVLPVGCCWSIDARNRPHKIPGYLITLSVRIIQLHLCIMYLACGIEKSMGSQWWNGEAIWIAMQQDQFHNVNIDWMASVPIVPNLLCWSTLVVESFYAAAIFWGKTKKIWLISIISMHAFIGIFLGLQLFGGLMILLNLAAFGNHCFPNLFTFNFPRLQTVIQLFKKHGILKTSIGV
ncbi:MAG TPA: HTTM domain-containing protein [Panacibacter sp.]|nr:HTTM domain-containing protein [Panacibacter sp.]